jgi:hypothetical protein
MPDQRKVGHSARRRMGASSSHLGQAGGPGGIWSPPFAGSPGGEAALAAGESTARGEAQVPFAGGRYLGTGGHLKGVPDTYETGTDTYGMGAKPPLGDSGAFVSGVASAVQPEPHPPRTRGGPELANSRLTVSPSMKVPQESPVPTQGQGRVVPSTPSRQGSFSQGQAGAYGG